MMPVLHSCYVLGGTNNGEKLKFEAPPYKIEIAKRIGRSICDDPIPSDKIKYELEVYVLYIDRALNGKIILNYFYVPENETDHRSWRRVQDWYNDKREKGWL